MTDKSKFEAFKQNEIDQNENNYGDEIRKKYGNKVIEESNQKIKGLSKADYQIYESKNSQIKEILVLLKNSKNYESDLEKKLFELHYEWLSFAIPNLNKEIHKNIAQMYVEDERFKAYYEKITVGGALLLRNVIIYHYDKL